MEKVIDKTAMVNNAEQAAKWLKAIANPYRLMILCQLLDNEYCVNEMNEHIPLSQSALSQHLAVLRKEQLVDCRKSSQVVYYRLKNDKVREVIAIMYKQFCSQH
ncbi:MAG: ArsR/SmtB family transcription factor [Shewanella sp.]